MMFERFEYYRKSWHRIPILIKLTMGDPAALADGALPN